MGAACCCSPRLYQGNFRGTFGIGPAGGIYEVDHSRLHNWDVRHPAIGSDRTSGKRAGADRLYRTSIAKARDAWGSRTQRNYRVVMTQIERVSLAVIRLTNPRGLSRNVFGGTNNVQKAKDRS
jgi:hypothetical protein